MTEWNRGWFICSIIICTPLHLLQSPLKEDAGEPVVHVYHFLISIYSLIIKDKTTSAQTRLKKRAIEEEEEEALLNRSIIKQWRPLFPFCQTPIGGLFPFWNIYKITIHNRNERKPVSLSLSFCLVRSKEEGSKKENEIIIIIIIKIDILFSFFWLLVIVLYIYIYICIHWRYI